MNLTEKHIFLELLLLTMVVLTQEQALMQLLNLTEHMEDKQLTEQIHSLDQMHLII